MSAATGATNTAASAAVTLGRTSILGYTSVAGGWRTALLHDRRGYLQCARLARRSLVTVTATVAVTRPAILPLRWPGRTLRTAETVPTGTCAGTAVWIAARLEAPRLRTGRSGLAWLAKPS